MAIKGPRRPDGPRPAAEGGAAPLSRLEQALLASGLARTPAEARALAAKLVAALKQAGFSPPAQGSAQAKTEAQLKNFQARVGLPATGRLDPRTVAQLGEHGLLPARLDGAPAHGTLAGPSTSLHSAPVADGSAPERGSQAPRPDGELAVRLERAQGIEGGQPKGWRDFALARGTPRVPPAGGGAVSGPRAHEVARAQVRARAELARDEAPSSLRSLLDGLAALGFAGVGQGKGKLTSALEALQASAGLPVTGRLDERTVHELVRKGALPDHVRRATAPEERGAPAREGALVRERARTEGELARSRGAGDGQGSGDGGNLRGEGAGAGPPAGAYATLGHTDRLGDVEDERNAPAGDDNREDRRRGHATLHDDSDADEGHYEVPLLSVQIASALEALVRDEDTRGATTYSWDVTFYRPGVYGRRQPAEPLWHLVVERAAPFDPVWGEAREALTVRLGELEPESSPPTPEDFAAALRRARVRQA